MANASELYEALTSLQSDVRQLVKDHERLLDLCQDLVDAKNDAPADSILSTVIEEAIDNIEKEL